MEIDLQNLREMAENCQRKFPSPWSVIGRKFKLKGFPQVLYSDDDGSYICCHGDNDADYIAACHPAAMIAILDRMAAAEAVCEAADCLLDKLNDMGFINYAIDETAGETEEALAAWRSKQEGGAE